MKSKQKRSKKNIDYKPENINQIRFKELLYFQTDPPVQKVKKVY